MSIIWIPVEQRVPDTRRPVLTWGFTVMLCGPEGRFLGVAKCNLSRDGHRFDNERHGFLPAPRVTHWAEIEGPLWTRPAYPAPPGNPSGVGVPPAPQPTPYGLAGIEGDAIVIRLTADACAFAFANDPQAREPRPPVINKQQFLRDTLSELTAEREDGSTPLTDMLDRAMVKAMENGSDALDHDADGVTEGRGETFSRETPMGPGGEG